MTVWMHDSGLVAEHDQPCYVCHERPAMYEMVQGAFGGRFTATFQPCSQCQSRGWRLSQEAPRRWWQFWI